MMLNGNPQLVEVTPSDVTVYNPPLLGLRVGGTAGTLEVISGGAACTILNVETGETIPGEITKVLASGTSATDIVGWRMPQ